MTEAPIITFACHCNGCQKMASSAFSMTAIFMATAFEVTKGETVVGGMKSPDLEHRFCPECMTWMFTRPAAWKDIVNVRPTMLDDHAWFAPFAETYMKTKLPWVNTGAVHSFEEFPPQDSFPKLMADYAARSK